MGWVLFYNGMQMCAVFLFLKTAKKCASMQCESSSYKLEGFARASLYNSSDINTLNQITTQVKNTTEHQKTPTPCSTDQNTWLKTRFSKSQILLDVYLNMELIKASLAREKCFWYVSKLASKSSLTEEWLFDLWHNYFMPKNFWVLTR